MKKSIYKNKIIGDWRSVDRTGCPIIRVGCSNPAASNSVTVPLGKTLDPHCLVQMWATVGRRGFLIGCQASVSLPSTGRLELHMWLTTTGVNVEWMNYGFNVKRSGYLERLSRKSSHYSPSLWVTWRRAGWPGWEWETSSSVFLSRFRPFLTGFARCPGKVCPGGGSQASGGVLQPSSHLPYVPSEGLTDPHPQPCGYNANGVKSRPVFVTELQQIERKEETKQVRRTHAMEFWTRIVKSYIS